MAEKNIQMKQKNGTVWDNLFPQTKSILVTLNDGRTVETVVGEILTAIGGKTSLVDVQNEIKKIVGSSPAALDTLQELAAALNNDASFASTITNALGNKVNISEVVTVAAANKILKLDSNSKLPASITGNADGNAASATKLQTARTISLTGDVTGSVNFDGSGNASMTTTKKNSGVVAGTYRSVTVDAKGDVTAGTNPTTISGYGITDAYTKTQIDAMNANLVKLSVSATEPAAGVDFWFAEI